MKGVVKNLQSVVAVFVIILGLAAVSVPRTFADWNPVLPPGSAVSGLTYGQWSEAYWQYVLSIPTSENPLNDSTGQNCELGQSSSVFFLAGTFVGHVTRTCIVPAGTPILIPIINADCSNVEAPPFFGATAPERRACVNKLIDGVKIATLKATVDFYKVRNLRTFRIQSPDFEFTMPETDNILGVTGKGTTGRATSDGYWLMLEPLSPGKHTIHTFGECVSGDCAGFSQDITYELKVGKP
jgi:hypothetical protein